jgi:RNA polymerase-interacting CarD/CdnL/TRCF family regulator
MSNSEKTYEVGDWIVHLIHGVGQVQRIENMLVRENKRPCYRVRTDDGTFWLPVDNANNKRVRSLTAPERFQHALGNLRKAPKKMKKNYQSRRKHIQNVMFDGDLNTDVKLIRDLNARMFRKGLSFTEQAAFNTITKRFLQEWTVSIGINLQEARQEMNRILKKSRYNGV